MKINISYSQGVPSPRPSPLPKGRGRIVRRLSRKPATGLVEPMCKFLNLAKVVPFPGGEGQGEGERHTILVQRDCPPTRVSVGTVLK